MCVCVCERERGGIERGKVRGCSKCGCVRERKRKRGEIERERESVCVCVWQMGGGGGGNSTIFTEFSTQLSEMFMILNQRTNLAISLSPSSTPYLKFPPLKC